MAIEKHGFIPRKQKQNPKGKYNDKVWVKIGAKDIVNIDEIDSLIYNNMSISDVYDKMDSIYNKANRKKGSGRPKKNKNEQEQ